MISKKNISRKLFQISLMIGISFAADLTAPLKTYQNDIQTDEIIELKPYSKSHFSILTENDAYFDAHTDYYYTAGTSFIYTTKEFDFSHSWLRFISIDHSDTKLSRFSFGLHQDLYTPIKRGADVDLNDFPYAGFLSFDTTLSNRRKNSLENLKIQIGIVGPAALAKQTQQLIHKLTKNPIFYGWDTQLKNEFILNFYYEYIYRYEFFNKNGFGLDVLPGLKIALGNAYDYMGLGYRLRLGYHLQNDFGAQKINTSFIGSQPYSDDFSFYVFGGIIGYYVARNIFVQGNSFGPHRLDLIPLTYEAELGAVISYKGFSFSYVFTHKSAEFRGSRPYHNFGSILLGFAF